MSNPDNIISSYKSRLLSHGGSKRGAAVKRERRNLVNSLRDSMSWYEDVLIDGYNEMVYIVNSDNLNEKKIFSITEDGQDDRRRIKCGSMVEWAGNHWVVTELDANNEIYTRAKMLQCNYVLRWVDEDNVIQEQQCVVEDGTKYLTGEYEDRHFVITRGDTRLTVTIPKDSRTEKFDRTTRFIIDDDKSSVKLAYALTKPLRVGHVYNGEGVYIFVLQEVPTTDYDNLELGIADYYRHFPKNEELGVPGDTDGGLLGINDAFDGSAYKDAPLEESGSEQVDAADAEGGNAEEAPPAGTNDDAGIDAGIGDDYKEGWL